MCAHPIPPVFLCLWNFIIYSPFGIEHSATVFRVGIHISTQHHLVTEWNMNIIFICPFLPTWFINKSNKYLINWSVVLSIFYDVEWDLHEECPIMNIRECLLGNLAFIHSLSGFQIVVRNRDCSRNIKVLRVFETASQP